MIVTHSSPSSAGRTIPSPAPYYARSAFQKFTVPALLYSAVSHLSFLLLRPFPFLRLREEPLLPDDCFRLPPIDGTGNNNRPVALVTGSNTGVGFETAVSLAERGYDVILACRSRSKGEEAAELVNERVKRSASSASEGGRRREEGRAIFLHPLDLSSFASVRSFHRAFQEKYATLNILVNNAGMNSKGDKSEDDGFDLCFQTNFMGHYLLTRLLLPSLAKAQNMYGDNGSAEEEEAGRIVNLSSVTHHFCPATERVKIDEDGETKVMAGSGFHDEEFWRGSATHGVSGNTYRESKLAALLFTLELNKRCGELGIRSVAVNPGSVNSDIWRNYPKLMQKVYRLIYLNSKQGSSTSVAAAVGKVPKNAVYLQPYWQPRALHKRGILRRLFKRAKRSAFDGMTNDTKRRCANESFRRSFGLPFPVTEMLGPYIGHAVTKPRLPDDGAGGHSSAAALWNVCEKLTGYEKPIL